MDDAMRAAKVDGAIYMTPTDGNGRILLYDANRWTWQSIDVVCEYCGRIVRAEDLQRGECRGCGCAVEEHLEGVFQQNHNYESREG